MDRRIGKTRAAIKRAFVELLAEKTFESISIHDIAERADVNRGTVYAHFADKYDLLDKCMEEHFGVMENICLPEEGGRLKRGKDALLAAFEYFEEHHSFYYSMLTNRGTPYFRPRMQQVMKRGIEAHIRMDGVNRSVSKDVLVQFTMLAAAGMMEWWIVNRMPYPARQMAEEVWKLLERHDIKRPVEERDDARSGG